MVDRRRRRPGTNAGARDTRRASRPEPRIPQVVRKHGRDDVTRQGRTIFGLSTARAVILAVVVCGLALTLAVPLRTYFTQRSEAAQVEAERVQLEQELDDLHTQRDQQQDPAFIKAEARERLRLVMPGETPYQVQLPGAYEAEQERLNAPEPHDGPWYSDLWHTISGPE